MGGDRMKDKLNETTMQFIKDMKILIYDYMNKRLQEEGTEEEILSEINGILLTNLIICFSLFTYNVADENIEDIVKEYIKWIGEIFGVFYKNIRQEIKEAINIEENQQIKDTLEKIKFFKTIYKGPSLS